MSVRIESEVGLREALDGLAREKEILFDGGYAEESDGSLYQGLVGARDALMTGARLRLNELKFLYTGSMYTLNV